MISNKSLSNQITQRDPILRSLRIKWRWTNGRIILVSSYLTGFIFVILGSVASSQYTGSGNTITNFFNICFIAFWLLLFSPLMWGAYLWQAQTAPRIFDALAQNGVFDTAETGDNSQQAIDQANTLLNRMSNSLIGIITLAALAFFWFNEIAYLWPEQLKIQPEYWYGVKWYLPFHVLAFTVGLYALFVFAFRQVIFVFGLAKIFRGTEVKIKPLHPDNLGGFGVVGEYVKSSLLFIIGFGIIASLFALQFYITGQNVLRRTDALLFLAIYITLAPISLIIPIFSVRRSMLRAREREMSPIADEFQKTLELMSVKMHEGSKEIKAINEKLDQLQQYRERLLKLYPTLPVSIIALQGFSITAILPLVSGIASLVLQFLRP